MSASASSIIRALRFDDPVGALPARPGYFASLGHGWDKLRTVEEGLISEAARNARSATTTLFRSSPTGIRAPARKAALASRPAGPFALLTRAGRDLLPVLVALKEWGDRYLANERRADMLRVAHRCGRKLRSRTVCASCGEELRFEDLVVIGGIRR